MIDVTTPVVYAVGDPDPTRMAMGEIICAAEYDDPDGLRPWCTWRPGHVHPQHVAGDGHEVVAVWPADPVVSAEHDVAAPQETGSPDSACQAQAERVLAVHARYFDMDGKPGRDDTCPEPEDVWRYDRDFRAALAVPSGPAAEPTTDHDVYFCDCRTDAHERPHAAEPTQAGLRWFPICGPCVRGEGQECHTPECALFLRDVPDGGVIEAFAAEPRHPCGHATVTAGCGGCDPGAIEYVITDDGVRRPFDPVRDMAAQPSQAARDRAAVERARNLVGDWQANGGSRALGDPIDRVWYECARQLLDALAGESDQPEDGGR